MDVASLKSRNRIASSMRGAMTSAASRDFGMLDPLLCALALTGNKEHQARCQSSRSSAFSGQRNQKTRSSHRRDLMRVCVGVHFSTAVSFWLAAEQSIQSRTSGSKPTRPKRRAF